MRSSFDSDRIIYLMRLDRMPVVWTLIAANLLTFIILAITRSYALRDMLIFNSETTITVPWTLLTYPLVALDAISMLFSCYWLWWAGGSLERGWGSRNFAIFFAAISAISALGLLLGSIVTGVPVKLAGLWIPLAGVTVAFGMLNPEQLVLFFFVIPMKLKYLALLTVILVFINYVRISPLLALLALSGCAAAYWYVNSSRLSFSPVRRESRGQVIRLYRRNPLLDFFRKLNPLRWYRDYKEKQRLKKFFDRSDFR